MKSGYNLVGPMRVSKRKKKSIVPVIIVFAIKLAVIATMFPYILLGWQDHVILINIYLHSTIMSTYIAVIASVVLQIINLVINSMHFTSARKKTVTTLIKSLLKYSIAIVAIVLIMIQYLGYNYMTELFAGLGVVALVIGLGCQNLIYDVIAGIFMVFEGNYQVGDVVVVGTWRGTVNEIGLRTTVIEDIGGNLKIINNSSITEIVNNSQVLSFAICYVGIEYDEDLKRVESVISKNLASIKEEIVEIVEGPYYNGVEELASSSVNLMFVAKCEEEDKFTVQRQLNRQIKLMFDKNNINIPFAQLTISNKKPTLKARTTKTVTTKAPTIKSATTKAVTPKAPTPKVVTPKAPTQKPSTPKSVTPKAPTTKTQTTAKKSSTSLASQSKTKK